MYAENSPWYDCLILTNYSDTEMSLFKRFIEDFKYEKVCRTHTCGLGKEKREILLHPSYQDRKLLKF